MQVRDGLAHWEAGVINQKELGGQARIVLPRQAAFDLKFT